MDWGLQTSLGAAAYRGLQYETSGPVKIQASGCCGSLPGRGQGRRELRKLRNEAMGLGPQASALSQLPTFLGENVPGMKNNNKKSSCVLKTVSFIFFKQILEK